MIGIWVPSYALAATAPATIEEVVVTARRTEERLQTVPVAVTALGSSFLQQHSVQQLTDLNAHVPALEINGISSPDQFQLGIRAQRNAEYGPGEDPSIGVYFAEVPYNLTVGLSQQFVDLDSIQVLRGPQGTLFGLSTPGGAILFTPKKPVNEFGGSVVAGLKAFSHGVGGYGTAILNAPVVPDRLVIRAVFNLIGRPGFVADNGPVPSIRVPPFNPNHLHNYGQNDDHSGLFRLSVLARPNDTIENTTILSVAGMRDHGSALHITALNPHGFVALVYPQAPGIFQQQQEMYARDFWTTQSSVQQYVDMNSVSVINTTRIDLGGDLKLTNVGGLRSFNSQRFWDLGALPLPTLTVPTNQGGKEYSEEIRLDGSAANGIVHFTTGLFYFGQDAHVIYGASVLGGAPNTHPVFAYSRSLAAYLQSDIKTPVEGLTLTAGIRYTNDLRNMRIDGFSAELGSCVLTTTQGGRPYTANNCNLIGSKTFNTPTWTLGLNYQVDPRTLLYVASRHGYRAGAWPGKVTNAQAFLPIQPEKVTDVEIGIKRDWQIGGATLRTNGALYRQNYEQIQRPVNGPGIFPPIVILFNAAGAHISGGEFEAILAPARGVELSGSLAYVDARYTSFINQGADYSHNEFANTPKFQYTLSARYTLDLPKQIGAISFVGDYFHQSHVFFTDTQQSDSDGPYQSRGQDAYGIANFRIDWDRVMGSEIDASFFVTNAFAQKYLVSFQEQLYASFGFNAAGVGEPRVFGLEVRHNF